MVTTSGGLMPQHDPGSIEGDARDDSCGAVGILARVTSRRFRARLWRLAILATASLMTLAATHPLSGPVTMSGFDAKEREVVLSALRRYEAAGLELPRTHVRRVGDGSNCGVKGRSWDIWPVRLANICLVREDVVVHELAHVWSFTALSRLDKSAWTARRHMPSWRSRIHPWEDRSAEHAADIMTWDLYWSELGMTPSRISGDVSVDAYLADVAWLIAHAEPDRTVTRALGPFRPATRVAPGLHSPTGVVKRASTVALEARPVLP